jgi:hypothetical protein
VPTSDLVVLECLRDARLCGGNDLALPGFAHPAWFARRRVDLRDVAARVGLRQLAFLRLRVNRAEGDSTCRRAEQWSRLRLPVIQNSGLRCCAAVVG